MPKSKTSPSVTPKLSAYALLNVVVKAIESVRAATFVVIFTNCISWSSSIEASPSISSVALTRLVSAFVSARVLIASVRAGVSLKFLPTPSVFVSVNAGVSVNSLGKPLDSTSVTAALSEKALVNPLDTKSVTAAESPSGFP